MSRETSIEAYRSILDDGTIGRLQKVVYDFLFHNGPLTTRQIHSGIKHIARDVGIVSTRLTELTRVGIVKEVTTVKCEKTGKLVILWDVTDSLPIKFEKPERIKCGHCKGKGYIIEQQAKLL